MEGKYINLLKYYSEFEYHPPHLECSFVYDGSFRSLITEFKLDEVMGNGSEWARICSLLEFVSSKYISNNKVADVRKGNVRDLSHACEKAGGSSYTLSRLLTEFLIAIGLKARYVVCMPYYYKDESSFTLVHVYSHTYDKWVMLDPYYNGYVTDENHVPLSIGEIRGKLGRGEVLICNSHLHYNQQILMAEHYLYDLAHYIFQFEMNQNMGYGMVASESNPIVHIAPVHFDTRSYLKKRYKNVLANKNQKNPIPLYTTQNLNFLIS